MDDFKKQYDVFEHNHTEITIEKMFEEMGLPNDDSRMHFLNNFHTEFDYKESPSTTIVSNNSNVEEYAEFK